MTGTQSVDQLLKETLERLHKLENQLVQQGGSISAASQSVFDGGYITNPTYFENIAQINDEWEELDYDGFLQKLYRTATNEPEDSPFEDRDAELRWWDSNTGYYINAFPFLLTVDEESTPWLLIDQALAVRTDFYALGMLTSGEGVLNMYGGVGWGPDGFDSNPFVWLAKGGDYGDKDSLEIRRTVDSAWGWGGLKCGDLLCQTLADIDETEIQFKHSLNPYTTNALAIGSPTHYLAGIVSKQLFPRDPNRESSPYVGIIKFDGTNNRIVFRNENDDDYIDLDPNCYTTGVKDKGSSTTAADGTKTISFNETFASTPYVICQPIDASGRNISLVITAKSNTQFSIKVNVLPPTHKHKIGQAAATAEWTMEVAEDGTHDHGFPGTAAVDIAHNHGDHSHGFPGTAAVDIDHTHTLGETLKDVGGTTGNATISLGSTLKDVGGTTGTESTHTHSIGYNAVWKDTQEAEGHVHSYEDKEPQSPSGSGSSHNHGFPGTAAVDISHSHGSHSHGFPGTAAVDIDHTHTLGETLKYVGGTTGNATISLGSTLKNVGGTTGEDGAHTHDLDNKAPYARGINFRTEAGAVVEAGATMCTSTDTSKDLFTEATDLSGESLAIDFDWIAIPQ